MTACYVSPEVTIVLSQEEIRKRYQDTALIIFKEEQGRKKKIVSYLSFGNSRRTMEYSNNGNHPVVVRKPVDSVITRNAHLASQMSLENRKPGERCAIT
ncbi:PREDICTED: uncharacterized protein LOC105568680 [Vollenhovia emeryi]|uniref:uncharacterized protein LOC105568680 n=1 Tax=Vollenhovia emeryi TaxID=411798 RepID=UPI0005F4EAAE|nr:PREDICTED: uncharacterized protein LOC105568680 [Vollenhovia emeryi]XP_011879926.1 PREDICTED: uncharacterized protein LOC105568680 [Vollenhovia emeryi]XP_011879927.1 PREDICTED: uncharacterized protein LOC105568680 [Vollenhovia emeryi]